VKIDGKWVGLGLGDRDPEVLRFKNWARPRFSYARDLDRTELFDELTTTVVGEMQLRLTNQGRLAVGKYIPGILNAETKYASGFVPRPAPPDTRGVLLTACGTGVPWWIGPDADTARAVEWKYKWRPIGYRAAPVPMGPSIAEGVAEGIRIIFEERERIERFGLSLMGYSQGAIVVVLIWAAINTRPDLAWVIRCMRKAVTFGNPMRERGKAWPDAGGQLPSATSGGIAEVLMQNTPVWWRDYAHKGDLYTDVEPGHAAENKIAIFKIVMGQDVFSGPDSILRQVMEVLTPGPSQIAELIGVVKAVMEAGMFFVKRTGPHINYSTREAIAYLSEG
jgi:hypothetical protein